MQTKWFACLVVLGATGCPSADVDQNETGPIVEFDPANKIVPFPNNLLLDPATGKVNLPEQCNESPATTALRENTLNKLDGFGTYEVPINITFSEPVDMASLTGHAFLFKRATGTTPVDPSMAVPITLLPIIGTTLRFDAACANPAPVDQVSFIPLGVLEQNSTYVFALTQGVKTATGAELNASGTWGLVRSPVPVVTFDDNGKYVSDRTPLDPANPADLEKMKGLDLLWKAHHGALEFLKAAGKANDTILIATDFNTQTTTTPLQPAVAGTPAAAPTALPIIAIASQSGAIDRTNPPFNACQGSDTDAECFLKISVGQGVYAVGNQVCALLACSNIGNVLGGGTLSKQYLTDIDNTLYTGTGASPLHGAWTDPVAPTVVHDTNNPPQTNPKAILQTLILLPTTAPPANGYPTVLFQHGLGRGKTDAVAIAGHLAGLGFAVVAIDAVDHDSRAVRISNDASKGCADQATSQRPDKGPSPTTAPQCYSPFLSPDLGATRDGIRQTVLDHQQVITSLKACGTTNCGPLQVDATKIFYMGQSLGGIIGSVTTSLRTDIKASVLNVPGVGWADILENTNTLQIQCLLVDGLIDAGILQGDKFDPTAGTGLCTTPAWKEQPGYQQFAVIGRWVLDPADPANYTPQLATKRFLIQEVVDDQVVPNIATNNEGALVGQEAKTADPAVSQTPPPSAAIAPGMSLWVQYPTLPPDAASGFPGNTFSHGCLLAPANTNNDGILGTVRMQTDALTFLVLNKN